MFRFLMIIFVLMCVIWAGYIKSKGYSMKQGLNGFIKIFAINIALILFFSIASYLSHQQ